MFWNERLNTWNTALRGVFHTCRKASEICYTPWRALNKGMNTEVIFKTKKWPNICGKHPDKFEQASCACWYFSWTVMVLGIMCVQPFSKSMVLALLGVWQTGDDQKQNGLLSHTPYSPDLALKMKLKPKVKQFNDILHVHRNFQQVLNGITKEDFQWQQNTRVWCINYMESRDPPWLIQDMTWASLTLGKHYQK
jgi:hypothetical protein